MKCVRIAHDFSRTSSSIIRAAGVDENERAVVEAFASEQAVSKGIELSFRYDGDSQWLEMLPNYGEHLQALPTDKAAERLSPIIEQLRERFQIKSVLELHTCNSCE
jgi:hypothetical protein